MRFRCARRNQHIPQVKGRLCEIRRGEESGAGGSYELHAPNPLPPWCPPSQYCGSCYLHGTLSMVQDRISVKTGGLSRVMLGRQTFLNCAPLRNLSHGCNGGDVPDVLAYMTKYGLPDETCM
jgi:hypothetical protein